MMYVKNKMSNSKKLLYIFCVLFVITTAYSLLANRFELWPFSTHINSESTNIESKIDNNPASNEQVNAGKDQKQQTIDSTKSTDTQNTTTDQSIGVIITRAIQNDNTLSIRSLIDTVTNNGECTLTLTNGTKTITKTSGIQASASSSTCKGFDIAVDPELSTGTWHIKLLVTIGNITGQAEQDKVLN